MLLSPLIGHAFAPSRGDYMQFINYHNRLNPEQKIHWQLGWDIEERGPTIAAAWRLNLL